jgi:hypothetical protein
MQAVSEVHASGSGYCCRRVLYREVAPYAGCSRSGSTLLPAFRRMGVSPLTVEDAFSIW